MKNEDFYYTVQQEGFAEFKDKGSRFLAFVIPLASVDDFKKSMEAIKKQHPKASHYCFAYRIGLDGNQYRVNDDGEPSGTAGKPIFGLIESKSLTNILIIVVRYFGGTLLGVPGLINAYRSAASLVLQTTPIIQKAVERDYLLEFDYTTMNDVMMIVKQYGCTIQQQDVQLFCHMQVGIPQNRLNEVLFKLKELRSVDVKEKKQHQ